MSTETMDLETRLDEIRDLYPKKNPEEMTDEEIQSSPFYEYVSQGISCLPTSVMVRMVRAMMTKTFSWSLEEMLEEVRKEHPAS